jgi:isopentenyl diphosphate isomerase/L-lactate dehydrogenase-like FMN-dependent dehydrogenase
MKIIKSKRLLPSIPYFLSLIEWKAPSFSIYGPKVRRAVSVEDLAKIAKKRTPKVVFDYVDGSATYELAYKKSREAFDRVEIDTRVLQNVANLDTSEKILGKKVDLPILFAPTGYTRLMYHVGEPAVAQVSTDKNLIYSLSNMGTFSPEELVEAVPEGRKWFQLYVMQNREASMKIINQAKAAGFEALIMTVDTPVAGLRYRDMRNGLTIPPKIRFGTVFAIARKPIWWLNLFSTGKLEFASYRNWNRPLQELAGLIFDPAIALDDIKWLRSVWDGPIIIKGIQSVEDAKAVSKLGIQGIIVSNHGGRQLDRGPIPLEVLPEIVKAVGKKVEVYLDGGVMSGIDAATAIALGAKAVFIGRAYLYGAMAYGQRGVDKVIEIMRTEFINTMALTGARTVADLRKKGASIRK